MAFNSAAAGNFPNLKLPDYFSNRTKADASGDYELLKSYYGPSETLDKLVNSGERITASTLYSAYSDRNEFLANIIHYNANLGTGWWFDLCPIKEMQSLNQQWSVTTIPNYAMDIAPEDTAPRLVSHERAEFTTTMARYSIGTEMKGDFFKRPEGKEEYNAHMTGIVTAVYITAKIIVTRAVIDSKSRIRVCVFPFILSFTRD
jgi:hypothetical protein